MNLSREAGEAMKVRRGLKYVAAIVSAMGVYLCATVVMDGYHMYRDTVAEISLEDEMASIRGKENYAAYRELPEIYVDAVLSVEDHRLYNRPEIDVIATGQAVLNDIRAEAFVGSGNAMMQQLVRNIYFTQEKELQHKAVKVFVVSDLEHNYSKNKTLELYVNTIYYGSGRYRVKDVSRGYLGKEPEDMTDYESTLLTEIPNMSSKYASIVSQELADKRQEQVLTRLVKYGYSTEG